MVAAPKNLEVPIFPAIPHHTEKEKVAGAARVELPHIAPSHNVIMVEDPSMLLTPSNVKDMISPLEQKRRFVYIYIYLFYSAHK